MTVRFLTRTYASPLGQQRTISPLPRAFILPQPRAGCKSVLHPRRAAKSTSERLAHLIQPDKRDKDGAPEEIQGPTTNVPQSRSRTLPTPPPYHSVLLRPSASTFHPHAYPVTVVRRAQSTNRAQSLIQAQPRYVPCRDDPAHSGVRRVTARRASCHPRSLR